MKITLSDLLNTFIVIGLISAVICAHDAAQESHTGPFHEEPQIVQVNRDVVAIYAANDTTAYDKLTDNERTMLNVLARHMGRKP